MLIVGKIEVVPKIPTPWRLISQDNDFIGSPEGRRMTTNQQSHNHKAKDFQISGLLFCNLLCVECGVCLCNAGRADQGAAQACWGWRMFMFKASA